MAKRRRRMSDAEQLIPGVTREALAALLERHGLGPLHTVERLAGGEVNPMLRVNDALVVRFNQRDPELPKLAKEALIYRRLRSETDVPAPEVLALDRQRDLVPFDGLITSYVAGVAGGEVWSSLDGAAQERVSEELGRMFGAVHGLRWHAYGQLFNVPDFPQSVRWSEIVMHKVARAFVQAEQLNCFPPRLLDTLVTIFNDGESIFDTPSPPTLTHSDLWLWNVILRREGDDWRVAAIVDWEWSLVADASWEFADLWRDPSDPYPLPAEFMQGYRERQMLPVDFQVRRRLYRLLYFFEKAVMGAAESGADSQPARYFLAAIERLLRSY